MSETSDAGPDIEDASTEPVDAQSELPPAASLCNGDPGIRLKYHVVSYGEPGNDVRYANHFVIAGDCRYWVITDPWRDAHVGRLSETEARELIRDTRYEAWASLAGGYGPEQPVAHAGTIVVSNGSSAFGCTGRCTSPGNVIWDVVDQLYQWSVRLYDAGTPVSGPMRLTALQRGPGTYPKSFAALTWPLISPLEEFLVVESDVEGPTPGTLVTLEEDLTRLRALREKRNAPYKPWRGYGLIQMNGPEPDPYMFELYFRDVTEAESLPGFDDF